MNFPQMKEMLFLSNHSLAYMMSFCVKHKGQRCFSRIEPDFSSTWDEATSSFHSSCRVIACKKTNLMGGRNRKLHLPLIYNLHSADLLYRL